MLAGVHDALGRGNSRLDALAETRHRRLGPLTMAWSPDVVTAEAGEVTVWVDGFLLRGDASALAQAWEQGAAPALAALRGAFTVVVWDARRGEATMANDHMSLRACLVHGAGAVTTWASDVVTLRAVLATTPGPDERVLSTWMAPLNEQGHATMLAGVERVGAGRLLTVSQQGRRRRRYWDPQYRPPVTQTLDEAAAALRHRLDAAITLRMDPQRPTAIALSGGLDSTLVASLAVARHGPDAVRGYSATFPRWPPSDESSRIKDTRAHLGIRGRSFAPRPQGAVRLAIDVIRRAGLPPGGPGGLVELAPLRQAAEDGLRFVLDGQGGDEVLGSSPLLLADRLRRGDAYGAVRLLHRTTDLRRRAGFALGRRAGVSFGLVPLLGHGFGSRRERRALVLGAPLRRESEAEVRAGYDPLIWRRSASGPLWWRQQRFRLIDGREQGGLSDYLWERGLERGLRSAAPLMDPDLVEHSLAADPELMWARVDRPVARRAVADLLPASVRTSRRKANIGPFYLSLATGADAPAVDALLGDPGARVRAWMDPAGLEAHVRYRPTPEAPDALQWMTTRWRMATAELWLRWLEDPAALERMDPPDAVAD